jgi:hypothetical protein
MYVLQRGEIKMADSPRRLKFVPATGDRWRHETVQGHISVSVTTRRTRRRDPSPSDQHIAAPAVTRFDEGCVWRLDNLELQRSIQRMGLRLVGRGYSAKIARTANQIFTSRELSSVKVCANLLGYPTASPARRTGRMSIWMTTLYWAIFWRWKAVHVRTLVRTSYIVRWDGWPSGHSFMPFGCGLVVNSATIGQPGLGPHSSGRCRSGNAIAWKSWNHQP